jgi:hypothetical protein
MLATDFQTMVHRHLQTCFVTVQTILNTFTHLNAIRISHVFGSFIPYYFDPTKRSARTRKVGIGVEA